MCVSQALGLKFTHRGVPLKEVTPGHISSAVADVVSQSRQSIRTDLTAAIEELLARLSPQELAKAALIDALKLSGREVGYPCLL